MKKVILCPNPYRDSELRVCKEAKKLLEDLQSRNERMFLVTFLVLNTCLLLHI